MPEDFDAEICQEAVEDLIARGEGASLRAFAEELHPVEVAEVLELLEPEERQGFYRLTGPELSGEALAYLPRELAAQDVEDMPPPVQGVFLGRLSDDDLAEFFEILDQEEREELFPVLPPDKRSQVRKLLGFPEDSVGRRMTTVFAVVRDTMTVGEAKRALSPDKERIELLSRIFLVDRHNHLKGKVRLRDLTFSPEDQPVAELADEEKLISIGAEEDQENAARLLMKYDQIALPVISAHGVLLGILTHDDAMDILQEESEEDIAIMSAVAPDEHAAGYLETSVFRHYGRRIGWVVLLAALGLLSGYIIFNFQEVLANYFILAIYMPMLVAAGGNTGGQAATLVLRAMALDEFEPRQFLNVLWKELRVGLMLGLTLAFLVGLKILFVGGAESEGNLEILPKVMVTVSLAFVIQVVTSTTIGGVLPIAAKACRLDPAVLAAPMITTFVDVSGLFIYFTVATLVMGL